MSDYIQEYVDSIESENSRKVAKHIFKRINVNNDSIENYNVIQMEHLILSARPNSGKEITTIIYILSSYFKYLEENGLVDNDNAKQIVKSIDKKLLWKKAKPLARKKFISYEQFKMTIHDIEMYEEFNSLYYTTLFSCIYHGIYSDDMSVLKNLRASDIQDDGLVTLREDNSHIYKIKVPEKLAKDMKQLASINIWQRPNRYGICNVDMRGVYKDSVFKVENRSTSSEESYKFTYYAKLRKISKDYIEYTLSPLQLYTSGMMHRIKDELNKNDITLEEAFAENSRNKMAHLIVSKELLRCNSSIEIGNFRELVKSHLDIF